MSQVLDSPAERPPLRTRAAVHGVVGVARILARLPPRRIVNVLHLVRRGARPATHHEALRARHDVTGASTMCAGRYCLQRSLATALLCRARGAWPTWCSGVRIPNFGAHAWVAVADDPVGEPTGTTEYQILLSVPPTPAR